MHAQHPVTYTIDQVEPQPIRWLWPGVIPRGKITVICGDPGLGKSFLTLDMAARVSRGREWPGGEEGTDPSGVVILNAEDDPADTIRPRLEAMDADLARVTMLDSIRGLGDRYAEFDLGEHTEQLREAIEGAGDAALVIVDPVSAYVGATDSYNNAHVRAMLKPLADLAADTGVAIVLVTHLRKSGEGSAVQRAMGSLAFTAAARVVLMVAKHPGDADLRILANAKSNVAPDRTGYVFEIDEGRVAWQGSFEGSADELLAGDCRAPGRQTSPAMNDFKLALDVLLERGGAPVERVRALAESLGVRWDTARSTSTKRRLGVQTVRRDGAWCWVLDEGAGGE